MSVRHVVVIGAGVAGLAAAYALRRADGELAVTILEGSGRPGGKLHTSPVAGVPVEAGAEMFLARVPEAVELAAALDLPTTHPATTAAGVVVAGRVRPLPAGTVMGVPADPAALDGVLSPAGVARARAERPRPPLPPDVDVSIGGYVADRLGDEVVDRLVDPLLGGVYAGHARGLSLRATVPALATAAERYPTLWEAAAAALPPARTDPVFATVPGGLSRLVEGLAAATGADLRLRLPARELHRTPTGFRVVAGPVPDPTELHADAVVVAVPARPASRLLTGVAPVAAAELAGIEYASMALVTLALPAAAASRLTGSGLLVPAVEDRVVKALTWTSVKWAHLAGEYCFVRASIGRHGEEAVLQRDDAELVTAARADLAALTGVDATPVDSRVSRWGGALPQYAPGHLERVRRVREAVAAVPGLAVAGAAYEGVGIPACLRSGYAAASHLSSQMSRSG
jgi:protoporphyrinogen/coproporphyrinogen III oxidase